MKIFDKYSGQIFRRKICSGKLRFLHFYNEEKYSAEIFMDNIPQ